MSAHFSFPRPFYEEKLVVTIHRAFVVPHALITVALFYVTAEYNYDIYSPQFDDFDMQIRCAHFSSWAGRRPLRVVVT
jgi:hypothetical protein